MVQGKLFHNEEQEASPALLTEEEILFAVAISTVSSPAGNRVWEMLHSRMAPGEMYRTLCVRCMPAVQEHLVDAYSGNPLEAARRIIEAAAVKSIRVLTFWDVDYPPLLREIQCPPAVLYVKGDLPDRAAVAIVGTRRDDPRSAAIARRIAREMSVRGYAVISGMAVGIDREAHLGALDENGQTVGVLANGIDIVYPWPNRDLYRMLESTPGSALISEYPPGIMAGRWTFVRRNRIISGLCAGTVVVKAGERSGALITARHAMEQNREVFACAGTSFDAEYAGCHSLIRNGAALVSNTDDISGELSQCAGAVRPLPTSRANGPEERPQPPDERTEGPERDTVAWRVLNLLRSGDFDIDTITRKTAASTGEVNEAVVMLELDGRITRTGNMISLV